MSINAKTIGFLGIEAYDLILFLSKLLLNLNQKVLLIDNSDTGALTCCIPVPDSLNPKVSKVSYQKIDFVKERASSEYEKAYDFILIDFGFKVNHKEIGNCSILYLITDKQQHNTLRFHNLKLIHVLKEQETYLIIKDLLNSESAAYLTDSLRDKINNIKQYFYLFEDDIDRENMVSLQYNNEVKFRRQSGQYKNLLMQILTEALQFNRTEVILAYKKAKRGV
ncbi:hypothetical protein QA584_10755 [Anaerocolumna sp. AGMB13025]|uniref:hypothetical protein n=1 Tax=Anaerocolumna sp. AGMB13025 TaxID=3039116 RepID=UPI00241D4DD4|nr:hypothetical protein [Anaerocolumna sp. AGMB13025]WFR59543.1 hypothetical protein QA584_10755 [Anaerocolumna sp. AGMB13025]